MPADILSAGLSFGSCASTETQIAKCKEHGAKGNTDSGPPTHYFHLITVSVFARTLFGIVTPICFAVSRLITSSNFVGYSIGKSPGLAPLRILST
jgi:hypothetical protein